MAEAPDYTAESAVEEDTSAVVEFIDVDGNPRSAARGSKAHREHVSSYLRAERSYNQRVAAEEKSASLAQAEIEAAEKAAVEQAAADKEAADAATVKAAEDKTAGDKAVAVKPATGGGRSAAATSAAGESAVTAPRS